MFINNNRKLLEKNNKIYAPIITKKEFENKLIEFTRKYDEDKETYGIDDEHLIKDTYLMSYILYYKVYFNKKEKYIFDIENLTTDTDNVFGTFPDENNLLGIHISPNGIPFLGAMAGGDWEYPLFFIFYYDGEDMQIYVPEYGNYVNIDFKTAFGSEEESPIYNKILKEYMKDIPRDEIDDVYDEDIYEAFFKRYGIENEEETFGNWEAVLEDITTNIISK